MRIFRKELFLRDNVNYIPVLVCETPWWEKCDGVEVCHDDGDLPNVYHANVNGYEYIFHEDWCEEIEDDE